MERFKAKAAKAKAKGEAAKAKVRRGNKAPPGGAGGPQDELDDGGGEARRV